MAAKAESNTEKALAYIAKHPGARSPEIAEAIGAPVSNVTALLNGPVQAGFLVVCKVERPGKPPINEYRLSATVAEDKVSWSEFRLAHRANVPLTKAPTRPTRNAAPATTPAPVAATKLQETETKPAERGTNHAKTVTAPRPVSTSEPRQIRVAASIVFMVDSTGKLRIEIPNHPPVICNRDETRDAGRLMISTEPVWS